MLPCPVSFFEIINEFLLCWVPWDDLCWLPSDDTVGLPEMIRAVNPLSPGHPVVASSRWMQTQTCKSKAFGTNCILILNMLCTISSSNTTPNSSLPSASHQDHHHVYDRHPSQTLFVLFIHSTVLTWYQTFYFHRIRITSRCVQSTWIGKSLVGKISNCVWKQRLRDGHCPTHTRQEFPTQLHIPGNPYVKSFPSHSSLVLSNHIWQSQYLSLDSSSKVGHTSPINL